MNLNLNLVFSKSMDVNLNLKIKKEMNGSNPATKSYKYEVKLFRSK